MKRTPLRRTAWRRHTEVDVDGEPTGRRSSSFDRAERKPMRRASTSGVEEREQRRALVADLLGRTAACQAGAALHAQVARLDPALADKLVRAGIICAGNVAPVDVHELLPRSAGGSIVDPTNCIAVCRACHRFAHTNPKVARAAGVLRSRYGADA